MFSSLSGGAFAQPSCLLDFQGFVAQGATGREAAQRIQARRLATEVVHDRFIDLRNDPEHKGFPDSLLLDVARSRVRATLNSPQAEKAFDVALQEVKDAIAYAQKPYVAQPSVEGNPEKGKAGLEADLEIFNNPTRYLDPKVSKETTRFEDFLLAQLAYRNLVANGRGTANASHIADHVNAVENPEVAAALAKLGISPLTMARNILLHDLGKEYGQLPADYRAFLEKTFPLPESGPDTNYLRRVILSHEFGSMAMIEQLANEAGISADKIPRLKALIAHHNAGYDPNLPGNHFWVAPFAWTPFAKALQGQGLNVPDVYSAVPAVKDGGNVETIVLTAIDRATSLTLASHEKFAPVLVSTGRWNNQGLAGQFNGEAANVMAEVQNVLGKLNAEQRGIVQPAIEQHFAKHLLVLKRLAPEITKMAIGQGVYQDRPATTEAELKSSLLYRRKNGEWVRVASDGQVFTSWKGQPWTLDAELTVKEGAKPDPVGTFFRRVLFVDRDYHPEALMEPKASVRYP